MNRASIVLIVALTAAGTAHAQAPAPNVDANAAYEDGRRLYDLREWAAAIAKFKEAYRLRPDAPSLFNIAQSYRLEGDCGEAANFYRTYKRNFPKEKNLDKVDKFIIEMDACTKTAPIKTEPIEPVKTEPAVVIPAPPVVPPPPHDTGKSKRVAGVIIGGVGVVSLGATVYFGLRARSASKDAEDAVTGDTWTPSIQSRGEAAAHNGRISLAVGAALIGTGVVLYVLGRNSSSETSTMGVIPSHDGATLVWGNSF